MQVPLTIADIHRDAGALTRDRLDDVAARICVERSRAFAGTRPVAFYGPLRGLWAALPDDPDPATAALAIVRVGRPVALSVVIHPAMPGLGDVERTDVAELQRADSRQTYCLAADRLRDVPHPTPILLTDQNGVPDVVVSAAALANAFAAAGKTARYIPDGDFRDFLARDRNRQLAKVYPPPALSAMARRQRLIAEATASSQARRLSDRGAAPLVPLRVTLSDLLGGSEGPVAQAVADYAWTVRQPLAGDADRVTGYATGQAGIALLARTFGDRPTRLLCLDPDRLEFDLTRGASARGNRLTTRPIADPIQKALDESNIRETAIVARQISTRVVTRTPPAVGWARYAVE